MTETKIMCVLIGEFDLEASVFSETSLCVCRNHVTTHFEATFFSHKMQYSVNNRLLCVILISCFDGPPSGHKY